MQLITQSQLRHYSMRHPEESATIEAVEHFLTQADLSKCRDKVMELHGYLTQTAEKYRSLIATEHKHGSLYVRQLIRTLQSVLDNDLQQDSKRWTMLTSASLDNIFNITIYYDT